MERATTTTAANTRARPLRLHDADPGPALEAAFLRIEREAMDGLPLLNKALRVQAVGFERWQGQWLGALVTPWFLNLVLVPGQAAVVSIHRLRRGAKDRAQLRNRAAITAIHEVGHTFGLDHCPEELCPMQDAEGSITNTDTSTGHLGPSCRTTLDARFPLRDTP